MSSAIMVRVVSQATAPDEELVEISDNLTAIERTVATVEAEYVARLQQAAAEDDFEPAVG